MDEIIMGLFATAMVLIILFTGFGGLMQCKYDHENEKACIEKTGNKSCSPEKNR